MKIAQTVKKNLASIGYSADFRPFNKQNSWLLFELLLTILLLFVSLIHVANTPRQYMDGIFLTIVGILIFISLVSTVIEMETIFILIDDVVQIIDKRLKYPKSKAMYEKTNQLAEKWSKIINFFIHHVSTFVIVSPRAIISFFIYYTTDAGPDAFELSTPVWLPFDWKNPIGYLIAVALQIRMVSNAARYVAYFLSLAVVSFLFSLSIAEDIVADIRSSHENVRFDHQSKSIRKQITELIDFSDMRRYYKLIRYFIRVYRVTLIVLFLGCTAAICLAMLMVQLELVQSNGGGDPVLLWESLFFGIWAINLVFVSCEVGQRFTNTTNEIVEIIVEIDWYLLSIEIQKMLLIIIAYSHVPIDIRFFGSISCSRTQFQKVINSGYKYFMVLRRFLYK